MHTGRRSPFFFLCRATNLVGELGDEMKKNVMTAECSSCAHGCHVIDRVRSAGTLKNAAVIIEISCELCSLHMYSKNMIQLHAITINIRPTIRFSEMVHAKYEVFLPCI